MLRCNEHIQTRVNVTTDPEISRILSAAVINSSFRKSLLENPLKAVSNGYSGETFELAGKAKSRLASIHADSLADFAAQIAQI